MKKVLVLGCSGSGKSTFSIHIPHQRRGRKMDYRRATIEDLDELVRMRIEVLRASNKLYEKYGFVKMNDEMELI